MGVTGPYGDSEVERQRLLRRRVRLAVELADEQVGFIPPDADDDLRDALLDELVKARYPEVHEGRAASYGCIVIPDGINVDEVLPLFGTRIPLVDGTTVDDPLLRTMASGRTTFLVRTVSGPVALVEMAVDREVEMVRLVRRTGVFVVQRTPSAVVKGFGAGEVWEHINDAWTSRPYAESRLAELRSFTGRGSIQVTANLLDLCVHLLSDRNVGATLVWLLDQRETVPRALASREGSAPPAELSVARTEHLEAIAGLLDGVDGACLIAADGRVLRVGAHLAATKQALRFVPAEGGTRHTSARRFSFDEPYALVFVVSVEGRVTVYSDGVNVLYVDAPGAEADDLLSVEPDLAEDVTTDLVAVSCRRCGKHLGVEVTRIRGIGGRIAVDCPVCGAPDVAMADNAFVVRALPAKPWSTRFG
jgi:DisA bacterial checkpoint controller nucleotide-binding